MRGPTPAPAPQFFPAAAAHLPAALFVFVLRPSTRSAFFQETHELYVKVLLDPFYVPGSRIVGRDFDEKVRALARRYLGMR